MIAALSVRHPDLTALALGLTGLALIALGHALRTTR